MKHRNIVSKKLDQLESGLNILNAGLNQNNKDQCYAIMESMKLKVEEIKSFIEMEPITGNELNPQN